MDREENTQLLRQVLGSVASQMRGSMGNIHAALRQLKMPDLPQSNEEEKRNAILIQSYYRLLRLMNNMTVAAELDGERVPLDPESDIVLWLEELIHQAKPLAEEQGLTLTFRCQEEYHLVFMNRRLMERLVWNLLSNAMKFTSPGGRIDVSLDFRDGQVLLTVADNGCGISAEMMDIVYERYLHPERLDPLPHGLGLGLPLCRRIAEGHGGRFLLTSREGEGTTVTVSLPDDSPQGELKEPITVSDGGFQQVMVELSDALSYRVFTRRNLDD